MKNQQRKSVFMERMRAYSEKQKLVWVWDMGKKKTAALNHNASESLILAPSESSGTFGPELPVRLEPVSSPSVRFNQILFLSQFQT